MGSYCSVAQLTARFASDAEAGYATDNEAAGVISSTVAAECIGSAEGTINSYLADRYVTPLSAVVLADTSVAELMLGVTLDIAYYFVAIRSPRVGEQIIAQYERRLEWLKMVRDGLVSIPGAVAIPGPSIGQDASWSTHDRTYPDDAARNVTRASGGAI